VPKVILACKTNSYEIATGICSVLMVGISTLRGLRRHPSRCTRGNKSRLNKKIGHRGMAGRVCAAPGNYPDAFAVVTTKGG
jgi:hypothetical protein